jgi:sarcosine oxidase subunit gamma
MVESYLRQSPLAHLGLAGRAADGLGEAGVAMAERPLPGIVDLRGKRGDKAFLDGFQKAAGYALPLEAGTTAGSGNTTALWLGPDEWWIVAAKPGADAGPRIAETLGAELAGQVCAITDVSESRACIRLSGPKARTVLQKGCPLDLHPRAFAAGRCAQSRLAKATAVIHLTADKSADGSIFDLYVVRSFAEYVWHWLEDAGGEFGVVVLAE